MGMPSGIKRHPIVARTPSRSDSRIQQENQTPPGDSSQLRLPLGDCPGKVGSGERGPN